MGERENRQGRQGRQWDLEKTLMASTVAQAP
jgi:hypothetical protein